MNSSQYKRHFLVTAGMVLLSFALLGVTFIGLTYQYSIQAQKENMDEKAHYMAALTGQLFLRETDIDDEDFAAYLGVAARLTDSDMFLCDTKGEIYFAYRGGEVQTDFNGKFLPDSVLNKVATEGDYDGMTTLGLFSEQRFVSGTPVAVT